MAAAAAPRTSCMGGSVARGGAGRSHATQSSHAADVSVEPKGGGFVFVWVLMLCVEVHKDWLMAWRVLLRGNNLSCSS